MLHGVEWLGRQYSQLAKPSGPNSVEGTIATLSSRLTDKEVDMADRRASILALKSLVRDHSNAVASGAMDHLIQCLVALEPPQGNQQQSGLDNRGRDEETTRAVVECLAMLCDPLVNKDDKLQPKQAKALASQHLARVDLFLSTASALHSLLPLLSPTRAFYTRFASLQLLSSLVRSRPSRVQDHVLVAPGGCGAILECLSEGTGSSAEIVRNEALLLIPLLVKDNADIQKLVAFEGAFEKLIDVVALEGRIEGGVVAQDALEGLEALLKYNVSNQNYFRETLSIPLLAPLLFYPPPPVTSSGAPSRQAEQEHARQLEAFAFQSWDSQKLINASLVISIAGMLVAGLGEGRKSNQNAVLSSGLTKALFELSLASTAPQKLKCQALNVLGHVMKNNRPNQEFLSGLMICPIVGNRSNPSGDSGFTPAASELESRQEGGASGRPSADGRASVERNQVRPNSESSGTPSAQNQATLAPLATPGVDLEEDEFEVEMNWTRLPARPAILALIGMAVNGPSSPSTPISPLKGLPMRTACLSCFSAFVADNLDVRLAILGTMMSPSDPSEESNAPLSAGAQLLQGLSSFPSSENLDPYKHLISSLLFSHLIRGSETAKKLAREISFGPDGRAVRKEEGSKPRNQAANDDDDDDENASLIQVLVGNLTMAAREQAEAVRKARSAQVSSVTNPSSNTTSSSSSSSEPSEKDWLRVQISYLIVLCIWLFESPLSVKDLLSESANLQVLIQPVAQGGGANDALIQGLSAFILGEVYEFGPQPPQKSKSQTQDSKQNQGGGQGKKGKHGKNQSKGQNNNDIKSPSSSSQQDEKNEESSSNATTLDREAIQPILISRIGPDTFASRLERVREDERFKEVDPEILEKVGSGNSLSGKGGKETSAVLELWFDFQFVEFWKNNYVLIQKSILVDPSSTSQAVASTSTELLDAQRQAEELRETVNKQNREIELLEGRMSEMKKSMEGEIDSLKSQLATLESSTSSHPAALAELQSKLDSSTSDHSKALSEVNSKHSATLQDSQENLSKSETKVKELQDQISKLEEAHLKSREEMESKLIEKTKELEKLSSEKAVEPPSSSSNSLSEEERKQLEELKLKKEEMEKENEDLLVLLEELSSKRKKDKAKMKEKGIEVSEDEEDDDDDEDEE